VAFALRRTGDLSGAEDVADQTFLQAWQALDRYEDRGVPASAWLYRIATNLLAAQARRARRVEIRSASAELELIADHADGFTQWEHAASIAAHLVHLTPDQRRAILLHFWEDRPLCDVAAAMGRSVAATKALLARALHAMRAGMTEDLAATA
jgi:RNA polymerase sigma-70 factor (ECF subfamily)